MSDYLRPEYTPLFTQVQDFIADQLNADPQLSALGIEFLPEHRLDIEYEIKNNLGKQGTVGIVNTLKGTYGGHNGSTNAWEIEAEVDVLENPPVRRAQMKKMGLSAGTTADILDWVQESLCAPSSPTYGKFCAVSQELGEDRGIIVGRSIMKTFAIADISAVVSGEHQWVCPYALLSDLSALQEQVYDLSVDVHGDYIEDADGNKIEADRTFTWKEKSSWFVSEMGNGYYTYDPPLECAWGTYTIDNGLSQTQTQMWMSKVPYDNNEYFGISLNLEYVEYYNKVGDTYVAVTGDVITEHPDDNSITMIGNSPCSITRTGDWSDLTATLATLDDLPTKTSDLTNDSGFITSAQVPTPDKIEDLSANVINANRTVSYIEEVDNWTEYSYPHNPLNWDAQNNWWRADISPSFYLQLQFNSGTWTLETGENIGGEWVVVSDSVQDSEQATFLMFNVEGAGYTLIRGTQQIQTTGELALKSYVDGIVGDINTILDNINGEVI